MELQYTAFEKRDQIGFITIDNPAAMNAITAESAPEIAYLVHRCSDEEGIRAVVLRGANGKFCGGGDVRAMKARNDAGRPGNNPGMRAYAEMILAIRNCEKPVVAWIEGACAGAGISLALACDLIAAEDCKFVFAFVNIGYVPDMGASYLLTRTVGKTKAAELFMLGNRFTGKEAKDWGVITDAVPADQLEETVMNLANKLANGPTLSYARIKRLINRAMLAGIETCMVNEGEYQYFLSHTRDHQEAVNAFIEKRKPEFLGR